MKGKMQGLQDFIRRTEQQHLDTITELSRRNRELEILLQQRKPTVVVLDGDKDILDETVLKAHLIRMAATTPLEAQEDLLYSVIRKAVNPSSN